MLACVLFTAFLAQDGPAPRDPRLAAEQEIAAAVSLERARDTVRTLVGFGPRMGGTESGARANAWRKEQFEALGLTVRTSTASETWVHEERDWRLVAHPTGAEPYELERAWPYGFSPSASGRAPLVLEGAEGAVLLTEQRPSRPVLKRTAVALALVDGSATRDGAWPVVHHLTAGDDNPAPVFGISKAEGERLREDLASGRALELEFRLDASIRRAEPVTVVGSIAPDPDAPEGYLLFCAHGDSDAGGPGANDNGSGEAIVFEIARAWSKAIREGSLARPAREVRFAIWGKEIHSTRAYLDESRERGETIVGVVNFDQCGFGSASNVLFLEPDDLPANEALLRILLAVLSDHRGQDGFPERWATNRTQGGTDSYVFSGTREFRAGVPALTLYASAWGRPAEVQRTDGMPGESWNDGDVVHIDYDNFYHSAGDVPELTTDLEPWNMSHMARVALLGGLRWLAQLP